MSIKQRIKKFNEYKGIRSIRKFEVSCGLSNGYVNKISNNIGIDKLDAIHKKYPDLNIVWLQMGIGEMINKIDNDDEDDKLHVDDSSTNNEPHFELQAIDSLDRIISNLARINDQLTNEIETLREEKEKYREELFQLKKQIAVQKERA